MDSAQGKKRYNLHLHKENTELVKGFLKRTAGGMVLSHYIDMLLQITADNIRRAGLDKKHKSISIMTYLEVLRLVEFADDETDRNLADMINKDPEKAIRLMTEHNIKFSDRFRKQ